jgi:hypothetical protein
VCLEKCLNAATQITVSTTPLLQEGGALRRRLIDGGQEDRSDVVRWDRHAALLSQVHHPMQPPVALSQDVFRKPNREAVFYTPESEAEAVHVTSPISTSYCTSQAGGSGGWLAREAGHRE